MRRLALETMAV
nr:TPA_asm: m44.8 sORF 1 [Murid betaherpesvirus 1]DBA07781.1 TPA_asm: m44.8 sORF 1 [Murid betaherpesvirus 1]